MKFLLLYRLSRSEDRENRKGAGVSNVVLVFDKSQCIGALLASNRWLDSFLCLLGMLQWLRDKNDEWNDPYKKQTALE